MKRNKICNCLEIRDLNIIYQTQNREATKNFAHDRVLHSTVIVGFSLNLAHFIHIYNISIKETTDINQDTTLVIYYGWSHA